MLKNFLGKIKEIEDLQTPAYIYSRDILRCNFLEFSNTVTEILMNYNVLTAYSIKSNAYNGLVRELISLGSGIDCVSGGEIEIALQNGAKPEKIVFAGVGKLDWEIELALQKDILQINAESKEELLVINEIATKLGKIARVSLRVNPHVAEIDESYTNAKISTGKKGNKFGIDIDSLNDVIKIAKSCPNLQIFGIACHIGSQILDISFFKRAFFKIKDLVINLAKSGTHLQTIDFGGGIGIKYHATDVPINTSDYARVVKDVMDEIALQTGHKPQIIFEPGRTISASCGILISKVLYVKRTDHKNFLIIDAGMNDLIRPAMYEAYHEIIPFKIQSPTRETEVYDIVGPICETGDIFSANCAMPKMERGDMVAILNAGAYGSVMSSTYNARKPAQEIMI